jgi:APA family basic amino acid/polyamine antiporter
MAKRSLRDIFVRKSVEQMHAEHEHGELKKSLGATNLVLLGIGCIIGTGIFVLTGQAAALHAGPAIIISFIVTGALCALVALSYAELASAIPVSGSAYSYSYASLGEFAAWIMGVLLVLEYGLAASTVAVGWSNYVASFLHDLGLDIPAALRGAPGTDVTDFVTSAVVGKGLMNLPAVIGIIAVTGLLVLGVSESAFVNNIVVVIKVTVVIAFIAIGSFFVNPALWSPLIPAHVPPLEGNPGLWSQIGTALWDVVTGKSAGQYGIPGIITGSATIFFAYIGFEAVSTAGAESRNPRRDMPIGILGSLVVCTILYILTSAVLVGIVPYTDLNDAAPIAKAVNQIGLPWFAVLVKIGAIAGLSSVMLVLLYGQTRIFYTMARDGLIPPVFSTVHPKFKTPWINTLIVGVLAFVFAGFVGLDELAYLTNVGTLVAFAIVCITVIYLRYARPDMPRVYKTPWFPLTPILGIAGCFILLMNLMARPNTRNFFAVYFVLGVVIYFVYGMWNSKLGKGIVVHGHEVMADTPHTKDLDRS